MAEWLYIDSCSITDLYAVAVALDYAEEKKRIVRTTIASELLSSHPMIEEIGFPSPQDTLVELSVDNSLPFDLRVEKLVSSIGGKSQPKDEYRLNYTIRHPNVLERLTSEKVALLYLKDDRSNPIDLLFVDEVCRTLMSRGIKFASVGDSIIPCIRGTLDLRGILTLPEVLAAISSASFLVTNHDGFASYACIQKVHSYCIEQSNDAINCNGEVILSPSQLSNMIFKNSI